MRVSDYVARFGPEFMDLEASGVIVVALTTDAPTVAATVGPTQTKQILRIVAEDGEWATVREMKSN